MRILVISDSHRVMRNVYRVLDRLKSDIDALIHLGDVLEDVDKIRELYPDLEIYNVSGNCDYYSMEPSVKCFELRGKSFFITHGHTYDVKASLTRLAYAGAERNADICLYGHTHMPLTAQYGDMFIMNPGSISAPRGIRNCSYGIIEIDEAGKVYGAVVGIFDNNEFKVIDVAKE